MSMQGVMGRLGMEDSFEEDRVTWLRENRKDGGCVAHIAALCEMNMMVLEGNINQTMIQKKLKIIEDY